jgi:hypothetical protein
VPDYNYQADAARAFCHRKIEGQPPLSFFAKRVELPNNYFAL